MKIKEFLREDPKQNSNALPNIALFRRLSFVVLKTTKFLYVMLLYPFYVFVRLSADVSFAAHGKVTPSLFCVQQRK